MRSTARDIEPNNYFYKVLKTYIALNEFQQMAFMLSVIVFHVSHIQTGRRTHNRLVSSHFDAGCEVAVFGLSNCA